MTWSSWRSSSPVTGCWRLAARLPRRPGSLLGRGFSIVFVELGAQLAERARRSLAGFPVEIHVVPFESWEGDQGAFDLVYAATAWH
jgi:hypothetical protein